MLYFYYFKYDFCFIFSPNLLECPLISSLPVSSYLFSSYLFLSLLLLSHPSSPLLISSHLFLSHPSSPLLISSLFISSHLSNLILSYLLLSIDNLGKREIAPCRPGVRSEEKDDDYKTAATAGTLLSAYVFLMYLHVYFHTILK